MLFFGKSKILGINARNLLYLRPFNEEKAIHMADNKLKTKTYLSARGITVPRLYASIKRISDFEKINFSQYTHGFVIKPNQGSKGQGIIIIEKRIGNNFMSASGKVYSLQDLRVHVLEILNGTYSLGNLVHDIAYIEQRIIPHSFTKPFIDNGLPDIRVIVHNLIPVMAMLRLPTSKSGGKGNLHQGAIGAGIDLAKGQVTTASLNGEIIKEIPNKGLIKGLKIPFWDEILQMASKAQLATNLGYLAADITIDKHSGPVLLEINARAGIAIQMANQQPLRKRLERIEDLKIKSISKGIRIAKDLFGYSVEKNIGTLSGKKVIGLYENIEILLNKQKYSTYAFINTSKKHSLISPDFAHSIGLIKSKKIPKDKDFKIRAKVIIGGKKIITYFKLDKIKKKYKIILGKRDITEHFLIDPAISKISQDKPLKKSKNIFITSFDPEEADKAICDIDNKLPFLKYIRPLNLLEEKNKFLKDQYYNPQLIYPELTTDLYEVKKSLDKIKYDDSVIGSLFKNKIDYLKTVIDLIHARGSSEFYDYSVKLFGKPDQETYDELQSKAIIKKNIYKPSRRYNAEEVKEIFQKKLLEYEIKNWKVVTYDKILAKCMTNKNKKLIINKNSTFSDQRINNLIIHEIETHLLTAENGNRQKYKLFNRGFANFLETQEGLAMYNVINHGDFNLNFHIYSFSEAIFYASNASFAEVYHQLVKHGMSPKTATNITFRIKRGLSDTSKPGALTKDYSYYTGLKQVNKFVEEGGDIKDLYLVKFNLMDLSKVKLISEPKKSLILPKWLD